MHYSSENLHGVIKELKNENEMLRTLIQETLPLQDPESSFKQLRGKKLEKGFEKLSQRGKVGVDAVEVLKLFHSMFFNKEPQKPVFLITYGPPGSGKSYTLSKVARQYHYDLEHNFVKILLDDMIKSMSDYNEEMSTLNASRTIYMDQDGNLNQTYYNLAEEVYFKYRAMVNQMKGMMLEVAYRQKLNIVYETTGMKGKDHPEATIFQHMDEARARGYKIIVVYPHVEIALLNSRLASRNKKQKRVVNPRYIPHFIEKAQVNFLEYLNYADTMYIFDNSEDKQESAGKRAAWLMKCRVTADGKRDFKCSTDICDKDVYEGIRDKLTNLPVCYSTCEGVQSYL